jgi:hypothetical protein
VKIVHADNSDFNRKLMPSVKSGQMDICECIVNMWSFCSIGASDLGTIHIEIII